MGKVSNKNKEKCAWYALGILLDRLVSEYGRDKVYWLQRISTSVFIINLFDVETGFWGEGVAFHMYQLKKELIELSEKADNIQQ